MMIVRHLFLSEGHIYRGHHGGPAGALPMIKVNGIQCVAGSGIVGDRYFDHKPDFKGQITFFEWEHLMRMWSELGVPAEMRDAAATRRNVIVEGLDLNSLVGKEFEIQGVRFLGMEECSPCYWMNGAIHPHAEAWMKGRGGLRAKILVGGYVKAVAIVSTLLTGGQSTRMGCDKSLLEIDGRPLWLRQSDLLRAMSDAVSVAAAQRPDWLPQRVDWVQDTAGVQGPLAGLLAALQWAQSQSASHLLALAVDLPNIDTVTLRGLTRAISPGRGVVPRIGEHYEPLAAVYPVEAVGIMQTAAAASRWKLQDVIAELVSAGLLEPVAVDDPVLFHNVNTPEDLAMLPLR